MYNERIENLINAALADGELTEKEKQILFKNAQDQGIDLDEFEMVLEARLTELEKVKKEAAPKSNKYGDVRKCPACGALVPAFKGVCQECGFEFTNIDANLSSKQLADKLLKENDDKKKIEIIETFPIPTTKADLLEFLTALKPRVLDVNNIYAKAYFKKYSECIEKAKVAFIGDKQFFLFIDDFDKLKKGLLNKKILKIACICIPIILAILIPASISITKKIISEKKTVAFYNYLSEQKAEDAQSVLMSMNFSDSDEKKEKALKLIELYISQGNVYGAIDVYDNIASPYQALPLIQDILIAKGDYDKAWEYSGTYYKNSFDGAKDYYSYMSKVVMYLCKEGREQDAKQFVKEYSNWFVVNVDPKKDFVAKKDYEKWINEYYREFNSRAAKSKLLNMINEY